MKKAKKKDRELTQDALKPENIKVRINTYIDSDILRELKKKAEKSGLKYQTLLNQTLRNALFGDFARDQWAKEIIGSLIDEKVKKAIKKIPSYKKASGE